MPTTWILAADRAKARLFAFDGAVGAISGIGTFVNPEGRGRNPAQDRLPRTHDRQGPGRLNVALGDHVRACVVAGLPKGITSADKREIVAHLQAEGAVTLGAHALADLKSLR